MVQKQNGIRLWKTRLAYKKNIAIAFLLLATMAYSCNQRTENTFVSTQQQNPNSLLGNDLASLYDSKYSKAGSDFIIAPKLAKQMRSKSDIFVNLGATKLEHSNEIRISQVRIAESKDASKLGNEQQRFLFVEKKNGKNHQVTDTLSIKKGEDYSINATFENNRKGIAVGIFYPKEEFFEIKALYEILKSGKKGKLDLKTTVIDCPAPADYVSDEDSGNYKFGIKNGKKYSRFWKETATENPSQQKGMYVLDSTQISMKDKTLKISVLEKSTKNVENAQHFDLKIEVSEKSGKNYKVIKTNQNIVRTLDSNCSADGFMDVVSKDNYFTIEQIFCKDSQYVSSYTTFKVSGNDILLHKYSESYTDRNNPDKALKDKIWTAKDFGQVKFEDFNYQTSIKK